MIENVQDKLRNAISECTLNPNVSLDDVRRVFELILDTYNLDVAFVVTNKEYKYHLKHLITCERPGNIIKKKETITLTFDQYNTLVNYYRENRILDKHLTVERNGCDARLLQCGIIRDDEYYGTVAFGRTDDYDWSEEERELIIIVSQMMLIFLGIFRLKDKRHRLETEAKKLINENTLEFFHVDLASGQYHALKVVPQMQEFCGEWGNYEDLFQAHINEFVNQAYTQRLTDFLSLESIKSHISIQKPTSMTVYPVEVNNTLRWVQGVAELAECDENNEPSTVLVYFDDITTDAQKSVYLQHAEKINHENYALIIGLDLETEQYAVYVNHLKKLEQLSLFDHVGDYRQLFSRIIDDAVDHLYSDHFNALFNLDSLKLHFSNSNDIVSFDFPHIVADNEKRWIRLEATKGALDSPTAGKGVILYFTDITEQKDSEEQFREIRQSLEKEHEHALKVQLQAMTDSLTGTYNRNAFTHAIEEFKNGTVPVGFVLIDIDNFKKLNDTYGHDYGDEVLTLLAKRLMSTFRNEDSVFRLGGDEFALLLYDCNEDVWSSLKMKFSGIHNYLKESLSKDISVSLSAGFYRSENGYKDNMFKLADEALYHTKNTGRAGISQIDANHSIINTWHDSNLCESSEFLQNAVLLGNWRAEFREDDNENARLFLDEASHVILEIPNILTPKECFDFWYSRLVTRHLELYHETVAKLTALGHAECVYHWIHPSKGEIEIHATAQYQKKGTTKEFFGYMRELKKSDIVLSYDDDQFIMQALNRMYFCTYYFNLSSGDYFIVKGHDDDPNVKELHKDVSKTFKEFTVNFVHPDFRQKVADFSNLETLAERLKGKTNIDCEYLSSTALGWCRTRIMPVKWDDDGNITHAISMSASIDDSKKAELDKEEAIRTAMKLQLRVGEIISKTSIAQTCIIDKETGNTKVWFNSIFTEKYHPCSFDEMKAWGRAKIYKTDLAFFDKNFNLAHIIDEVHKKGALELSARRVFEEGEITTMIFHFETLPSDASKLLMVIEDVTDIVPKGIEWMHQFDILEEVNEAISIMDYDNYDIVYMNKLARELLGMDLKTLRTKKCYEIFGDDSGPCSFCDKVILDAGVNGFMCREVKSTNQIFFIHGCPMEINGKKYRLEQAVPVSDIDVSVDRNIEGLVSEKLSNMFTF